MPRSPKVMDLEEPEIVFNAVPTVRLTPQSTHLVFYSPRAIGEASSTLSSHNLQTHSTKEDNHPKFKAKEAKGDEERVIRPITETTNILITCCVHGNEQAGMVAVNELLDEGNLQRAINECKKPLKLTILLGNPEAVRQNKRFLHHNLNRMIGEEHIDHVDHYESNRAKLIAKMGKNSDRWLDVHTTSAPSPGYALPAENSESEALASRLPIDIMIRKLVHRTISRGTTCDWALQHGKTCVCVECGQEGQRETIETAKRVILAFISDDDTSKTNKSQACYVSTEQVKVGKGFEYVRRVKAFEAVEYQALIARDEEVGEIRCPFETGAIIIMPTANPIIGEEAWFWGCKEYREEV
jgi:succinylglutamate desuccinylase